MRVRAPRWVRLAAACLMALGLTVAPVQAADNKPFREPGIVFPDESGAYITWLAGALFAAACLLVAVKNPHRSHLD